MRRPGRSYPLQERDSRSALRACSGGKDKGPRPVSLSRRQSRIANMLITQPRRPRIAVTLGDPAGIGPALVAKLFSSPKNCQKGEIVLLADNVEFNSAVLDAGSVHVPLDQIKVFEDNTAAKFPTTRGQVSEAVEQDAYTSAGER